MNAEGRPPAWWQTRWGAALVGFMAIAAFFLLAEHTAHVFGALPYLLLLLCPLMHAFMRHGNHGGRGSPGAGHPTGHAGSDEGEVER